MQPIDASAVTVNKYKEKNGSHFVEIIYKIIGNDCAVNGVHHEASRILVLW